MARHHLIVQAVREVLQDGGAWTRARLEKTAAEYAEACEAAYRRLRLCGRFLDRGLRTEAVQLADEAPEIIEMAKGLDFAERPRWIELTKKHQLQLPREVILRPIEDKLALARKQEKAWATLLGQHRRLALEHASAKDRLDVIRQLRALDPENPVWVEGLKRIEPARITEISHEAKRALDRCDAVRLGRLFVDLTSKEWVISVPNERIKWVAEAQLEAERRAGAQLSALKVKLDQAARAGDAALVRKHSDSWEAIAAGAGLRSDDAGWVAFKAELARLLDRGAPAESNSS